MIVDSAENEPKHSRLRRVLLVYNDAKMGIADGLRTALAERGLDVSVMYYYSYRTFFDRLIISPINKALYILKIQAKENYKPFPLELKEVQI